MIEPNPTPLPKLPPDLNGHELLEASNTAMFHAIRAIIATHPDPGLVQRTFDMRSM